MNVTTAGFLRMCEFPDSIVSMHGGYHALIEQWLGTRVDRVDDIAVHAGEVPASTRDHDLWIVGGAPESVLDDLAWIQTGQDIVRSLINEDLPTVGICFGHQLMAQAAGGTVRPSTFDWQAGIIDYRTTGDSPIPVSDLALLALHRDHVVEAPAGAEIFLTADQCPIAGLRYGERVWSVQPHPEFTTSLVRSFCTDRRELFGQNVADAAIGSLDRSPAGQLVADAVIAGVHSTAAPQVPSH